MDNFFLMILIVSRIRERTIETIAPGGLALQPDTATHHRHEDDRDQVARIRAGSTDHWHAFLERYAGLAYTVARPA